MMSEKQFQAIIKGLEHWQKEQQASCDSPGHLCAGAGSNAFDTGYMLGIAHAIAHVRCRITMDEVKLDEKQTTSGT